MRKRKISLVADFDRVVEKTTNGVYVIPNRRSDTFRIRDAIAYCKANNKTTSELTQSEIRMFKKR